MRENLSIPHFTTRPVLAVVLRYGVAVTLITAALGTALILRHYNLPHPFTSFSFVVIAATFWYGGTGPGAAALLLSWLAMSQLFRSTRIGASASEPYLVIYGIFGGLVGGSTSS